MTGDAYFALACQFLYTPARGAKYIFVLYEYNGSVIYVTPINSQSATDIKKAWLKLHSDLVSTGITHSTYMMDNEAASDLKHAILHHKLKY